MAIFAMFLETRGFFVKLRAFAPKRLYLLLFRIYLGVPLTSNSRAD